MRELDPGWKGKYAWSVSSESTWRQCKYMFFMRYVALSHRNLDASTRNKLYTMKKLTSLSMLEGRIIHEMIEDMIQQTRLGRQPQTVMVADRFWAALLRYKEKSSETITEAFNGLKIEDTFYELVRKDGESQIRNFIEIVWPRLSNLEYLAHEEFESFVVNGIRVNVKVDYVTKSPNGKIVLTDWKTGAEKNVLEGGLQMAVYGMWASSKYNVPISEIMVELAHLRSAKSHPIKLDDKMVSTAKETIYIGASEILATDSVDGFSTNPTPEKCVACPFARVCEDGSQILEECVEGFVR